MRKVIDGKVYDTDKADCVHEWDNGHYNGDFKHCEETLYRTPKGAYFLHGAGGALSKYARPAGGNSYTGGQDLTPLTPEEAMAWLEQRRAPAERIEEHFKVEEA